jgi:Exostosin family
MASLSSTQAQLNLNVDQGLPPPSVLKPSSYSTATSSQYQQEMQSNCSTTLISSSSSSSSSKRKYLLSFSGNFKTHAIRNELAKLDNVHTTLSNRINHSSYQVFITDAQHLSEHHHDLTYEDLLQQSQFVAVPRGHNLFSYRFSEVLGNGAIPVLIHNQEWILPFRPELVDWAKCVVHITAPQVKATVQLLQKISQFEVCQRRQYCYWIYETYMRNSSVTMQAIFDGLQAVQNLS